MNLIERDMLTRCLGPIYEQMLMGDTDAALASIEGVTWLVRYMAAGKSSQRATLENELRAVRAVFQICRGEVGLETGVSGLDPYLEVKRTAVLYGACQHGLELLHGGVDLRRLVLFRQREDLQYYFLDRDERVYGGTIYAEGRHPSTETEMAGGTAERRRPEADPIHQRDADGHYGPDGSDAGDHLL